MNRLMDLPDETLQSEFPELWQEKSRKERKRRHQEKINEIFVDQKNGELYLKHPGKKAEQVQMFRISDLLKYPKMPELRQLDEQKIIKDWVSLADDNIFDRTNANWETIRTDFADIWFDLKAMIEWAQSVNDFLPIAIKQVDSNMSIALAENYYKKTEVDAKILNLQKDLENRIANVQARVNAAPAIGPYANPSRTDQYPSNLDVNDKIQDDNLKTEINQLYETAESKEVSND